MERLTKRTSTISEPHVEMVTAVSGVNVTNILDRLAAYEDAEEAGLLIRLPCKVGDTVHRIEYVLGKNNPAGYVIGVVERKFNLLLLDEFGKTVFLTREEAEVALAKEKHDET